MHFPNFHKQVKCYNLDVIISVGYRVKSHRGTQFRIWATQRLREYIIKGFTMNDDLLKKLAEAIILKSFSGELETYVPAAGQKQKTNVYGGLDYNA